MEAQSRNEHWWSNLLNVQRNLLKVLNVRSAVQGHMVKYVLEAEGVSRFPDSQARDYFLCVRDEETR